MGRSKREPTNFCVDDETIQAITNRKVKKIQKDFHCKNDCTNCSRIKAKAAFTDPLEIHLTHPEGRTNEKRQKCKYLVNMQGDSNIPPIQKELFKRRTKIQEIEPELMHYTHKSDFDDLYMHEISKRKTQNNSNALCPCDYGRSTASLHSHFKKGKTYQSKEPCRCLGKIIYTDTKAQTEGVHPKNNVIHGILKNKHSTREGGNDNVKEINGNDIDIPKIMDKKARKSKQTKTQKQKITGCVCPPQENKIEIPKSMQLTKWPENPTGHEIYMMDIPNNIQKIKNNIDEELPKAKICAKGICAKAFHKNQSDFVCKCEKLQTECTDVTCHSLKKKNITQNKSPSDAMNIKNKLTCLCHKYSQKLLSKKEKTTSSESPKAKEDFCAKGICKDAMVSKAERFACKCTKKPKITECSNATCKVAEPKKLTLISTISQTETIKSKDLFVNPDSCEVGCPILCFKDTIKNKANYVNPDSCETTCPRLCLKDIIRNKFMSQSKIETFEHVANTLPRDAKDQTGEPLIEIKVNSIDMSVVNPDKIKNRVIDLGKNLKGKTCICRSHKKCRDRLLGKSLCPGGVCHKTHKNKKTNFNCKCQRGECTDLTCDGKDIIYRKEKLSKYASMPNKPTDPLFEVQFDSNRMHVLNPEEIQKNIIDTETESQKLAEKDCPGGICGDSRAKNRHLFNCKCVEKKRKGIIECSEETCATYPGENHTDVTSYWMSKLLNGFNNNSRAKMIRRPIDINEIRKIKSIFSSICDRLKSTSEIWTGSHHKRQSQLRPSFHESTPYGAPRVDGISLNLNKKHTDNCNCDVCKARNQTSLSHKCKSFMSCTLSGLVNRQRYTVNRNNFHRRSGLILPPQRQRQTQHSSEMANFSQMAALPYHNQAKNTDNTCLCLNDCECVEAWETEKEKAKWQGYKRKPDKGEQDKNKLKRRQEQEKEKNYESADKAFQKQQRKKEKLEGKARLKQLKQEQKEMKELSKQDEARETNCLADFVIGALKLIFLSIKGILSILFKAITDPKASYRYTRQRMRDPKGTLNLLKRWLGEVWLHQKFRMNRTIKGSRTMTILVDEVKETEVYQAFAYKGKTNAERQFIEASNKRRKKRIRKRQNEAVYGCRHMLLVTMRKTPCLWVYHICPNLYPQFLSARMFVINFSQMLLFCVAVMVWTPCIACCEACRALLCCMVCTH